MAKIDPMTDPQKVFEYFMQYGIKIIPIDINEENPSPYDFYPLWPPHQSTSDYLELSENLKSQCYFAVIVGPDTKYLVVVRINAKDENELFQKCEEIFKTKPTTPIIRHSEGFDIFFRADQNWLESMIDAIPEEFIQFSGFESGTRKHEGYLMMVEKYPHKGGYSIRSFDLKEGVKVIISGMIPVPPTIGYSWVNKKSFSHLPEFNKYITISTIF
ncbi:hypothetical protein KHC33_12150 [Methanospirillum sp. J.3.6.1-F.2.7.3]|uniref:Uncharacterized protein n=1 Tax=Methanospirillum purgamenti TaxID=2834276 RepID=A0A8E7B0C7_9EURY|nr:MULTISPECIES: hypothetical protein [Methanospirillum]MDX8550385.1 hypothetical protein [Methanospirillum hungatei]QVV88082.1 hypothetical protein KHC33_12150 [Methanospirillum sp. J.3.6.1-F.2.7.3]